MCGLIRVSCRNCHTKSYWVNIEKENYLESFYIELKNHALELDTFQFEFDKREEFLNINFGHYLDRNPIPTIK